MANIGEMPLEKIAYYIPLLSLDDLKEIEAKVLQLVSVVI